MTKPLPSLLGATLLHTRYGHWQHAETGRFYIRPVDDSFYGYPGIVRELAAIYERALADSHTLADEQRIQWLSQAQMGALDIYQQNVSHCPVNREEILEDVKAWFSCWNPWPQGTHHQGQHREADPLLHAFFGRLLG